MPRLKTKAAKEKLLRSVRKQRLKTITILPSLITILNGVCGFAAIVLAGKGAFAHAGYIILLAMIADMLDGRVARMSQSTSSFGGQLDSLCDVISFGVAPAFLTIKIIEHKLQLLQLNSTLSDFLQRFTVLAAATYLSCAAIRLARFNVENEEDESAHMSFFGLPTPAAAGVIVSLVIFHQETLIKMLEKNSWMYSLCESAIIYLLPLMLFAVGVLMVSRIRYPHIVNQFVKGKKPFEHLVWLLMLIGLMFMKWFRQPALLLIFCGFAASGFVKWFYYKVLNKSEKTSQNTTTAPEISSDLPDIKSQQAN
jgi:CDP-diacylglycerol--serine O-phosphatidyltransferase